MTCPACDAAEKDIKTGALMADCMGCQAREIAKSQAMLWAMTHKGKGDNEANMRLAWPEVERYRAGKREVVRWWKRLQGAE